MTRALLAFPPFSKPALTEYAPFGIFTLAAYAREKLPGLEIRAIDYTTGGFSEKAWLDELDGFQPDFVGISIITLNCPTGKQMARVARDRRPSRLVVMGGIHAVASPRECLEVADAVAIGDGENALCELLAGRPLDTIRGLAYRRNDYVIYMRPRPFEIKLDDLPFPAYDLLDMREYVGYPAWHIITSRGCPYRCTFCLPADTRVLMGDLTWQNIQAVAIGDEIIGTQKMKGKRREFVKATVVNTFRRPATAVFRIETEAGVTRATEEHPWLTHGDRWIPTNRLRSTMYLRKVANPAEVLPESYHYKIGYLAGGAVGDGCVYNKKQRGRKGKPYVYRSFGITGDSEMLDTFKHYAKDVALQIRENRCNGGIYKNITRILITRGFRDTNKLEVWMNLGGNIEYQRGFLAGFYDAEGSFSQVLRFSNLDMKVNNRIRTYLANFGFASVYEKKGIRLCGGLQECIRFFNLVQPKVEHKRRILCRHVHNKCKVTRISPDGFEDVFNLETTSGDFIADGFITHNCTNHLMWEGKMRSRSAKNVVDEIQMLHERYGVNRIQFQDDTINIPQQRAINICDEIIRRGLNEKMTFMGSLRLNRQLVSQELFDKLKEAGFDFLGFGVESGSQRVLDIMGKRLTPKEVRDAVRMARGAGIRRLMGFLMIGNWGETVWDVVRTWWLCLTTNMETAFSVCQPFPGTKFYKWAMERGYLNQPKWEDYNITSVVTRTDKMAKPTIFVMHSLSIVLQLLFSVFRGGDSKRTLYKIWLHTLDALRLRRRSL